MDFITTLNVDYIDYLKYYLDKNCNIEHFNQRSCAVKMGTSNIIFKQYFGLFGVCG